MGGECLVVVGEVAMGGGCVGGSGVILVMMLGLWDMGLVSRDVSWLEEDDRVGVEGGRVGRGGGQCDGQRGGGGGGGRESGRKGLKEERGAKDISVVGEEGGRGVLVGVERGRLERDRRDDFVSFRSCVSEFGSCDSFESCGDNLGSCEDDLGLCDESLGSCDFWSCDNDLGSCDVDFGSCADNFWPCDDDLESCDDLGSCDDEFVSHVDNLGSYEYFLWSCDDGL